MFGASPLSGAPAMFVHVEVAPGVVTVVAVWRLSRRLRRNGIRPPRVVVSALVELHQLAIERGSDEAPGLPALADRPQAGRSWAALSPWFGSGFNPHQRLLRKFGDLRAILKAMIDQRPRPTFTPRPVRDEWYIHVEWPDGRFEPIQHFQSESEAQHWIVENSERWLRVRGFIL